MLDRLILYYKLVEFVPNVYYQPDENIALEYPCIIYKRNIDKENFANDKYYVGHDNFDVTVIDTELDSPIARNIRKSIRGCTITAEYVSEGLYHTKLTIHY